VTNAELTLSGLCSYIVIGDASMATASISMAAVIRCQLILSDNDFIDKTLNFLSCFSFVVCPTDYLTRELSFYRLFVLCV